MAPSTPSPTVVSLAIDGNASFSMKGETSQLKASATLSDGTVQDETAKVAWTSSNSTIATVNLSGMLTAVGDGETVVTAKLDAIAATKAVRCDLP